MLDVGYGERIRTRREALKLSQEELGRKAGIDKETVNRAEHDQNVTVATLQKACMALELSMIDLFAEGVSYPDLVVLQPESSNTTQEGGNARHSLEDRLISVEGERDVYREALREIATNASAVLSGNQGSLTQSSTSQISGEHRGRTDRSE